MSKDFEGSVGENDTKKNISIKTVAGDVNIGESPEYQVSSAINELLNCLASKRLVFNPLKRRPSSATIIKIEHNNLQSNSHIINQYLDYSSKIEEAYSDVDSIIPFGKDTVLRNLYDLYYSALDIAEIDYLDGIVDIDQVREHSDFILTSIVTKLKTTVFKSKNTPMFREQIDLGVNVVVAHAFIECIIMENPNNDS